MIAVITATGQVTRNPEFYVMQLLAATAALGAVRLGLAGQFSAHAVAFRAPDGTVRCAESLRRGAGTDGAGGEEGAEGRGGGGRDGELPGE